MDNKKKIILIAAAAVLLVGVYLLMKKPATPPAEEAKSTESQAGKAMDKIKVGFIYVGPVGDHGWTYRHDEGRKAMMAKLGDKVETTFVESVPEADSERAIRKMAQDGNNLVFTTSFGFMDPTLKVAEEFPDVKFEHATGYKTSANVGIYNARFYEGRYPAGLLAGKMTKSNIIGYIASFPIPEVVMGINATIIGARSVNPKAEVRVVWVSTWYDPGKEADAAKALIAQGADVIFQHTDSPAPLQIAEEQQTAGKAVWAVGQASDMTKFAPKSQLTAIIDDWGPYYIQQAEAMLAGTWKSTDSWYGLKEGWVALAPVNAAVPQDVQEMFNKAVEDIKSGAVHPFKGPIKKQDGTELVKEGEVYSDKDLLSMNVFVEGVVGELPK